MYEKLIADVKSNFQPFVDVAEINRKALEKLTSLQSECMTDCFNAGLKQFRALTETKDPQAATELQLQFFKDLEVKVTNTAELNIAAFNEAKDEYTKLFEETYSRLSEVNPFEVNPFEVNLFEEMTQAFSSAANAAPVASKPVVKKSTAVKSAPVRKPAAASAAPKKAS